MTNKEHDIIDHIAYNREDNEITLAMVEEREWGTKGELLPDLQEKLNTYINYIDEERVYIDYPQLKDCENIVIRLFYKYRPGQEEIKFINIVVDKYLNPRNITWKESLLDKK